jgi:hypothetical protein
MILIILLGFSVFGEQFYCIDINQQLYGAPQSCYQLKQNIHCQIVDSFMQLIFEILMPALMMLIFGSLTFQNIRQQRRRIHVIARHLTIQRQPTNVKLGRNNQSTVMQNNRISTKRDIQLISMLLIQVSDRENDT